MRILLLLLLVVSSIFSQPKHAVYLQLLGPAGWYSLNYEQQLPVRVGPVGFAASAGVSIYNNTTLDLPILFQAQIGLKNQLHIGMGAEPEWYISREGSDYQTLLIGSIGYRHIFKTGFLLGIAFTPVYEINSRFFFPGAGLIVGWNF